MRKQADTGNYQARAQEFEVGQAVTLAGGSETDVGRVTAVYPAIGMVDVSFAHASARYPVEDVLILDDKGNIVPPRHENVPGGAGQAAFLSEGCPQTGREIEKMAKNVSNAWSKKALYWNARDRKYRCTRGEDDKGLYSCPRRGCDGTLKPAVYKREDGKSTSLMGCPSCMFLIKEQDIIRKNCEEGL